jgi:hypothetical protein
MTDSLKKTGIHKNMKISSYDIDLYNEIIKEIRPDIEIDELNDIQNKFINNTLETYNPCELFEKYIDKIDTLVPETIAKILDSLSNNGTDMDAILCLFNTLLLSNGTSEISKKIQKWVTNMKKLPINSAEGYVYITDILSDKTQVIVKTPRYEHNNHLLVNEYFIGMKALNKLRYIIPTFIYTLGLFNCNRPDSDGNMKIQNMCSDGSTTFVIYERIPGDSMSKLIEDNKITWTNWLLSFAQILLSLEIAQRECKYTHFDLHTGNVMVKENKIVNYSVLIDNNNYKVSNTNILPVIIDLGMSTAEIDGVTVGAYNYLENPEYAIKPYMIQGFDMYKFMVYSVDSANLQLSERIIDIFKFYGNNDPYNIYKNRMEGINRAKKEYCGMVTYSNIATYTPMELFKWLYKEYSSILKPYITISPRNTYIYVNYSSSIKIYDSLFKFRDQGREKAIVLLEKSIENTPSYIFTKYNIMTLSKYNINLSSPSIKTRVQLLKQNLELSKDKYISYDMELLNKVKNIKLPNIEKLLYVTNKILDIPIRKSEDFNEDIMEELSLNTNYQKELDVYLEYYYTILELQQEKIFTSWIKIFKPIFEFYKNNVDIVTKALNWSYTLINASK